MTDWIAVCAPGRKLITTLNTLFWEENVIDVWEAPDIEGSAVVLIDANPYQELRERLDAMPFDFAPDRIAPRPEAMYDWRVPIINNNPGDGWKIGGLTLRGDTENLCTITSITRKTAG